MLRAGLFNEGDLSRRRGRDVSDRCDLNIAVATQFSTDEFSIGPYYLDDVTLMSKTAAVQYELVMRDALLWRQVYRNGSGPTGAWDPTLFSGQLTVTTETAAPMVLATKGSMSVYIAKLDYLALPTGLAGNELVRIGLRSQLTQGANTIPVRVVLINTIASYPD